MSEQEPSPTDAAGDAPDVAAESGAGDSSVEDYVAEALAAHDRSGREGVEAVLARAGDRAGAVRERLARLARLGLLDRGSPAEALPSRVGSYRVDGLIGEGGMGVVYRAHDESIGRDLALKVLRPELLLVPGARERVRREAAAAAQLAHPNVASLHFFGEHDGLPFLAMELVEGQSLAQILSEIDTAPGELPPASALTADSEASWTRACLRVARDVALALAHAHGRGVLHRDVKPSNIIVDATGAARLVDFGLARLDGAERLTRTGTRLGSLQYMAPEQLAGQAELVDGRADVFALGATLYELLTRVSPFAARSPEETLRRIREGQLVPPRRLVPALTRDVEAVVLKALSTDVARRYGSAEELVHDLDNLLALRPVKATPFGPLGRARLWLRSRPRLATGAVAAVATGLLALAGFAIQDHRARGRIEAQRSEARESAQALRSLLNGLALSVRTRSDVVAASEAARLAGFSQLASIDEILRGTEASDPLAAARARLVLAIARLEEHDYDGAQRELSAAAERLDRAPEEGRAGLMLLTHAVLGDIHDVLGDQGAAQDAYRLGLERYEQLERTDTTRPGDRGTVIGILTGRAQIARVDGRVTDAAADLRRAREIAAEAPESRDANLALARLAFEEAWLELITAGTAAGRAAIGRTREAIERLEATGMVDSKLRLRFHRLCATVALFEGDPNAAEAELDVAREFLPLPEEARADFYDALHWLMFADQLGQVLQFRPGIIAATAECGQAIDLAFARHVDHVSIRRLLAGVCARQSTRWAHLGEVDRARAEIARAEPLIVAELRPVNAAASLVSLGETAEGLGDYPGAIDLFERALDALDGPRAAELATPLERSRSQAYARARLGAALTTTALTRPADGERAEAVLEQADHELRALLAREPSLNAGRSLAAVGQSRANLAMDLGDFELAAERLEYSLEALAELTSESPDPYLVYERAWQTYSLATAYRDAGEPDAFRSALERCLALATDDAELCFEVACLAMLAPNPTPGDYEFGLAALEAAAAAGFADPDALDARSVDWAPLDGDDRFARVRLRFTVNRDGTAADD